MALFSLEHSQSAYKIDFALYCTAVGALGACLIAFGQRDHGVAIAFIVLAGLGSWTVIEYVMHRFVLHGLQPFRRWHTTHHERPQALIYAPTILSGTLIATLVFLPALVAWNRWWIAGALTLGVLIGYLFYSLMHHAFHHWRFESAWLKKRKHWHALHHQHVQPPSCYGVTTSLWDHVFGSAHR